jgi:hypothetical protein
MTIRIYSEERTAIEEAEEKACGIMAWMLVGFGFSAIMAGCALAWYMQ